MKKCKECNLFMKVFNTDETGMGVCTLLDSYEVAHRDDDCRYEPGKLTCENCARLTEDDACMTCEPDDSAYHELPDGTEALCSGFIDKDEEQLARILFTLHARGKNIDKVFEDAKESIKELLEKWDKR